MRSRSSPRFARAPSESDLKAKIAEPVVDIMAESNRDFIRLTNSEGGKNGGLGSRPLDLIEFFGRTQI
jgi:hypothetical protein